MAERGATRDFTLPRTSLCSIIIIGFATTTRLASVANRYSCSTGLSRGANVTKPHKTMLQRVMAQLGSAKSEKKTAAARLNAKKGGRPKGSKNRPKTSTP